MDFSEKTPFSKPVCLTHVPWISKTGARVQNKRNDGTKNRYKKRNDSTKNLNEGTFAKIILLPNGPLVSSWILQEKHAPKMSYNEGSYGIQISCLFFMFPSFLFFFFSCLPFLALVFLLSLCFWYLEPKLLPTTWGFSAEKIQYHMNSDFHGTRTVLIGSGPERGVITKWVFSPEESLESLESLNSLSENGRILLCFPVWGFSRISKFSRISWKWTCLKRPLFQKTPFLQTWMGVGLVFNVLTFSHLFPNVALTYLCCESIPLHMQVCNRRMQWGNPYQHAGHC